MKKLLKQKAIATHNDKYAVMKKRRENALRYVSLLKAPKANDENT